MFWYSMGSRMSSATSVFSSYTAFTAAVMMGRAVLLDLQSLIQQFIPSPIRNKIWDSFSKLLDYFNSSSDKMMTLTFEKYAGDFLNEIFTASETYLGTKITLCNNHLTASKTHSQANISLSINRTGDSITDNFDGIELLWSLIITKGRTSSDDDDDDDGTTTSRKRTFELTFEKRFLDKVVKVYLPHVIQQAEEIDAATKKLRLYSVGDFGDWHKQCGPWSSVGFEHPSTFETLAMDEEMKKMVVDDLDRFIKRKEFYKRIGKPWKRGYLLYGPPGTGKSSLVAAMANYLNFDVYDLQLSSDSVGSDLRPLLVSVTNRSIVVIEDIDCTVDLENREAKKGQKPSKEKSENKGENKVSLSELLNFADGLWSSCGDERIIVFTTNYKDKLDPALLRPGRMDMHIHMSYLTPSGFKTLAFNYLQIREHRLFGEIEEMLKQVDATPAEVAENLLRSDDADVALEGLVKFLRNKKNEIKSAEDIATSTDLVVEEKGRTMEDDNKGIKKRKNRKRKNKVVVCADEK